MTMVCMCDGGSGGEMWGLWDNGVLLPKTPLRYVHCNLPIAFSEYFHGRSYHTGNELE